MIATKIRPFHAALFILVVVVVVVLHVAKEGSALGILDKKGGQDVSKEASLLGMSEKEKQTEEKKRRSRKDQVRNQGNPGPAVEELIAKPDFDFRLSKGPQSVILVTSDPQHLRKYAANILTLDCYCRTHGLLLWVVPSNHPEFVHCRTKRGFLFGRHCISASVLERNRDALEMLLVLDADIAVVNMQFDIRAFLPANKEMALAMRCHNQEVSASSYLVRNSDFTINFLKRWHAFEFPWNADNGALHSLLLDAMEIEDTCPKLGEFKLYVNYLRCFHSLVQRSNCSHNFFERVVIWQHFDGWEHDGWTVNYTWSRGLTFMHHAMKTPPIVRDGRSRVAPRFQDCRPGGAAMDYVDEFLVTDAKMNESMSMKLDQWQRSWRQLNFGGMQSCLWTKGTDHGRTGWSRKTSETPHIDKNRRDKEPAEKVLNGVVKVSGIELVRHSGALATHDSSQYYLVSKKETQEAKQAVAPVVQKHFAAIEARIKQARAGFVGHVGTNGPQMQTYLQALRSFQTLERINVCETGFNAGHSAALFLAALPSVHYYGWDLGEVSAARVAYKVLEERFPGRFNVTWGNSRKTLPAFFAENPGVVCNLVVVDGEHSTSAVEADASEFRRHLSAEWVMFSDDCLLPDGRASGLMRGFDASFAQAALTHSVAFRNPATPSPGFCLKSNFFMLRPEAAEVKPTKTLSAADLPAAFSK